MARSAVRLAQLGHNSMLVWVLAANPYRSFYEALGGQPVAERETNIGGAQLAEIAYGWQDLSTLTRIIRHSSTF